MQLYLIGGLIFSLLLVYFAVQNTEEVLIKFFSYQFPVPLVLVILGAAAAGALLLYVIGLIKQVGLWFKLRQLRQQKTELEQQVKILEEKVALLEAEIRSQESGVRSLEPGMEPSSTQLDS